MHPRCGHPCKIFCSDRKRLGPSQTLTTALTNEVYDGRTPSIQDNLPQGTGRCTELVTFHRTCGHTQQVACGTQTRSSCKEEVTVRSPLCRHNIAVPCWLRKTIESWHPWDDCSKDILFSDCTLPSNAKPTEGLAWPDKDVLDILTGCQGNVTLYKSCGHPYKEKCSKLLSVLRNGVKTKKGASCTEAVTRELPDCGHEVTVLCKTWQLFTEKRTAIKCVAMVEWACWNASQCGANVLVLSCDDASKEKATFCCPQLLEWRCKAGKHKCMLQLCKNGVPAFCSECWSDSITIFISSVKEKVVFPLPHSVADDPDNSQVANILNAAIGRQHQADVEQCVQNLAIKVALDQEEQKERFYSSLAQNLGKALNRKFLFSMDEGKHPKRPQFSPTVIPIFFVMDSSNKKKNDAQKHGFVRLNNFVKSATLNGIALHHMTRENMLCLANESKGSTKKELLCGYLFSSHLKVDCDLPTSKKMKEEYVKTWREVEGHDCVELKPKNGKYIKQIICWDPAAVYSIYRVGPLDADDMKEFAENIGAVTGTGMVLHPVSHTQSSAESRILDEIPVGDSINCLPSDIERVFSQRDSNTKNQGLAATTVSSLQGTWAEYLQFSKFLPMNDDKNELPLRLHSYSSQTDHGMISLSTERDLIKKLSLVNGNNENPFAGE